MLDAVELLHATSDERLEKLMEEAEAHKLEATQSAMVLENWKERMGVEEGGDAGATGDADDADDADGVVGAEMEPLDEDEEFALLEKKSLELEIRNLLSQLAQVQEELNSDSKGLDRAFDTVSSIVGRLDAKVNKLGDEETKD